MRERYPAFARDASSWDTLRDGTLSTSSGSPMTLGNIRQLGVRGLPAVCAAAIIGGCALSPNGDTYSLHAEPEKYDFAPASPSV